MLRLKFLQLKAKNLYIEIKQQQSAYSCGSALAEYINPDLMRAKQEFNEIWEEIRLLDSNAPKNPFQEATHV